MQETILFFVAGAIIGGIATIVYCLGDIKKELLDIQRVLEELESGRNN